MALVTVTTEPALWTGPAGGTAMTIQEDGVPLASFPTLNFAAGVTATENVVEDRIDVDVTAVSALAGLTDLDLTGLAAGQTIAWDPVTTNKWLPANPTLAALTGQAGRNYRAIACALRNAGSSWAVINDSAHRPTNVESVSTDATQIVVNYPSLAGTKVVGSMVAVDESMAMAGYTVGTSVGLGLTDITIARTGVMGDYISWNGSSFVAAGGASSPFTSISFSGGVLTLGHADVGDQAARLASVSGRGPGPMPVIADSAGTSQTVTTVEFYDYAGALVSTPTTAFKAYVQRGCKGMVNPQTINTTLLPFSNIWFFALIEV